MAANYGYLNARVRGMRSRLLGDGFVREVVEGESFEGLTTALAQSDYGIDLEEARARASGLPMIDAAIAGHVRRTTRSLLTMAEGSARTLLAVLLLRYDLSNLKALARAFHAHRAGDGEAVETDREAVLAATLPAGELGIDTLERMIAASDLPNAAQVLSLKGHPLAAAFRRAVAAYAATGDLLELEIRLDLAYYEAARASARRAGAPKTFERYLQLQVDATNLSTALKLRGRGLEPARFFVEGGRSISRTLFNEIALAPEGTPLPLLRGPLDAVGEDAGLAAVEVALRGVLERATHSLSLEPLNIGLVAHYLHAKEREAAQLRLVARGIYYGVPSATLKRELGDA